MPIELAVAQQFRFLAAHDDPLAAGFIFGLLDMHHMVAELHFVDRAEGFDGVVSVAFGPARAGEGERADREGRCDAPGLIFAHMSAMSGGPSLRTPAFSQRDRTRKVRAAPWTLQPQTTMEKRRNNRSICVMAGPSPGRVGDNPSH